jgi:hypothetical protein
MNQTIVEDHTQTNPIIFNGDRDGQDHCRIDTLTAIDRIIVSSCQSLTHLPNVPSAIKTTRGTSSEYALGNARDAILLASNPRRGSRLHLLRSRLTARPLSVLQKQRNASHLIDRTIQYTTLI